MPTTIVLLGLLLIAPEIQPPALRIVVIEGEDAVNVIQQKTAVAPVIEVRDRNNIPVAGATVTFSIGGNSASFAGGVQTFTVATNAAGQAAAAAVNPLTSGAVQIQVSAAFQGQTAIATIAQTNVLTAAEAAAAGASGTSGASGAAGGGGGISGTTLGIVGAAVAGGAVAATQVTGGDESDGHEYSGTFSGQLLWTFPGNNPSQSCQRVHNMSGTLRIELSGTTAPFSGTARIVDGSSVVASVTCTGGPQLGNRANLGMPDTALSGGAIAFTYQASNSFQDPGAPLPGIHTVSFSFTGTLNGDTITGSLTHGERAETPGSGFPAGTGTATYQLTLRR